MSKPQDYQNLENKAVEEFEKKFGKLKNGCEPGDDLSENWDDGGGAGCDDCRSNQLTREEHKQFLKSHLKEAYQSGVDKTIERFATGELLKSDDAQKFYDLAITAERERFIEKLNYLKQCANGKKFPYWEISERPDLIIREIDDFLQELQNK